MRALVRCVCAVIVVAVVLASRDADACSCAFGPVAATPSDGATNVPVNAELKLLVAGSQDHSGFELKTAAGERVPAFIESFGDLVRMRPFEPLEPQTKYVFTDATEGAGFTTSFTTGAARDEQAPTNGRVGDITRRDDRWFAVSSCGPSNGYSVELAGAADDLTPEADLWYLVYLGANTEGQTPVGVRPPGSHFVGTAACGGGFVANPENGAELTYVAVDLAGNEAQTPETVALGGCGCSSSATTGTYALAMIALLGLVARSRRVRRGARLVA